MAACALPSCLNRNAETAGTVSELLKRKIDVRIKVTGTSMAPAITSGDIVVLRHRGRVCIGDIVFYLNETGSAVLHRIVRLGRGTDGVRTFHTMGDALCTLEGPFPEHAIMGITVSVEPSSRSHYSLHFDSPAARAAAYLMALRLRLRALIGSLRRRGKAFLGHVVRTAK